MGKRFKKGEKIQGYAEAYGTVVGVIVDIDETSMVDPYRVEIESGAKIWVQECGAKLVPAWQPKVGDRVRIVDPDLFMRGTKIGNLATIEKIGSPYIEILLEHPTKGIVSQIAKLEDIGPIDPTPSSNDNAAVAKLSEDDRPDAGGGFKAGDRIRCVSNPSGDDCQVGDEFVAVSRFGSPAHKDSVNYTNKDGHNTWRPGSYFVLVEPTTPAIVALIENGTPRPSTAPKVHTSQEAATTEAERLALEHPGQQFGVFVLADSKIADLVMTPTAVLRAA